MNLLSAIRYTVVGFGEWQPEPLMERPVVRRVVYPIVKALGYTLLLLTVSGFTTTLFVMHHGFASHPSMFACRYAESGCVEYLRAHNGEWPKSDEDIEKYSKGRPGFSDLVTIDFTADPRALAQQSREEFTAIQLKEPRYRNWYGFRELFAVLREYHGDGSTARVTDD